jgi:hypothetical protein
MGVFLEQTRNSYYWAFTSEQLIYVRKDKLKY